jgi:hypothetical protein
LNNKNKSKTTTKKEVKKTRRVTQQRMEEEDFEDDMAAVRSWLTLASSVAIDMESSDEEADGNKKRKIDHRLFPRSKRTLFKHEEALDWLYQQRLPWTTATL